MLHRRDAMLRLGQVGLGALSLRALLRAERAAADPGRRLSSLRGPGIDAGSKACAPARAKSCIFLFLWGGPPQQDMWDMKPDAPDGIRSLFKPIRTAAPGIEICDQMPLMAQVMDRVTLIRSMTHGSDNHEPSVYHMLTGQVNP